MEQRTNNKQQRTTNARPRKGDDIAARILDAAELVRRLLPALRRDTASRHVAAQLWRAATGIGANYEEARSAESPSDFLHKLRVATKELREALYWLRITERSDWVPDGSLENLVDEYDQLIAIFMASARTAKSRAAQKG